MKFLTKITAIDPATRELYEWCGPEIEANDLISAEIYCRECLGYCEVLGEKVEVMLSNLNCN